MTSPLLELESVSRTFGTDPPVCAVKTVTFSIDPGEFVAIVGPSGSGKSTLLSIMGFLDQPSAGTYRFDGVDTETMSEPDRCRIRADRIGFVFQAFHLLEHRSIEENVELGEIYRSGSHEGRSARVQQVLTQVGLGHRIGFLPSTLSGGERQRVAIARAVIGRPALILCDEPTGNLDSETATGVLELLVGLRAADRTVIVITHDPTVASQADRQIRLLDGAVIE